jgi:type II secretory pathway pseudopilin PulG
MNPQFLIAKLAANATETSWSQAYSTLNFYVALSVSTSEPSDTPLAQIGKEVLEKLQREYFSLDEKSLESIKVAVENTVATISSVTYSLVLVTNTANTLLIITAEEGSVAIKRGEKLGIIAKGQKGSILSFSGPINHQDLIVVQTADFSQKIPSTTLASLLDSQNVTDLSENIAPHLHSEASGGEAGIILLYTNPETAPESSSELAASDENEVLSESPVQSDLPTDDLDDTEEITEPKINRSAEKEEDLASHETKTQSKEEPNKTSPFPFLPTTNFITKLKEKRKAILGILILVLLIGFIGTLFFRNRTETSAQNGEAINQALVAAQSDFDEGVALEPLNRPLALDKFTSAEKLLTDTKNKYPTDPETQQVNALLSKVEQKLSGFSSGTKVENGKKIISSSDIDLDMLQTVSIKDDVLFVTDKSTSLVTLSSSGEVEETHNIDSSTIIDSTAPNGEFAFVLTSSGVVRVNLESGDTNELFELSKARQAIKIFGSNVYLLNTAENMVEKYAPSSYSATDYLTEPLTKKGTDLAIDGSVYVLSDDGNVEKFTRGTKDSFSVSALQGKIGKKAFIYTEEGFSNIYVLDTSNQRILFIAQNGEVKQEYSWEILKDAIDFAVDEENKTIYVITSKDLFQFTW